MVTPIIIVVLLALFILAFLSRRRFGYLGLGLTAGIILSGQSYDFLETFFSVFNEFYGDLSPSQITSILLCIVPSLILMLSGPKYHGTKMRLIGALMYLVMAAFAILPFIMSSLNLPNEVNNFIMSSHTIVISIGIVISIIDCFLTRHQKSK